MRPLAFAADAEELIFIYGFSMVVSPFDRLRSARSQIVEKCGSTTAKPIIAQNANLVAEKIASREHAVASAAPAASSCAGHAQ
jgi:hypothetical protein